jgi:hypothetical protein
VAEDDCHLRVARATAGLCRGKRVLEMLARAGEIAGIAQQQATGVARGEFGEFRAFDALTVREAGDSGLSHHPG